MSVTPNIFDPDADLSESEQSFYTREQNIGYHSRMFKPAEGAEDDKADRHRERSRSPETRVVVRRCTSALQRPPCTTGRRQSSSGSVAPTLLAGTNSK